jgi:hypothetical protein
VAAAEIIQTDDKKVLCVDGFSGPDAVIPPTRLGIFRRVVPGGVVVSAEGVANKYCVTVCVVQASIGFIDNFSRLQLAATGQL